MRATSKVQVACESCRKPFSKSLSWFKRSKRHFCSMNCRNIAWAGAGHVRWKKDFRYIDRDGYVMVRGADGKRTYEHKIIAERKIGRPLKRHEVVHHINGIKTDNREVNLYVCTQSEHRLIHDHMSFLYQRQAFGHL